MAPLTHAQYAAVFAPYPAPALLADLLEFQNRMDAEHGSEDYFADYCNALRLSDQERYGLETWSEDPEFLSGLFPFAVANGSGSSYALWRRDPQAPIEAWPVVLLGDEGGEWIVARDLAEMLAITSADIEPQTISDSVYFFQDDEEEEAAPGTHVDAYRNWLAARGIAVLSDPAPVVETAQAALQAEFDQWKGRFFG